MDTDAHIVGKDAEGQEPVKQDAPPDSPKAIDFDRIGKAIAAIAAIMYVVGLLTVNTYLHRLGVSEFSLFKAKYIYAGALVLIPIVLSTLAPLYGIYVFNEDFSETIKIDSRSRLSTVAVTVLHSSFGRLLHLIAMIGLPFFVFSIALSLISEDFKLRYLWHILLFYFICFVTGLILIGIGRVIVVGPVRNEGKSNKIILLDPQANKAVVKLKTPVPLVIFAASLFLVGYFGWYLGLFTEHVYPAIPEQFGGGKPKEARLLFKTDALDASRELGIDIPKDHFLSSTVKILFENDESYVLRLPDQRVVRVNKDMIRGIEVMTPALR